MPTGSDKITTNTTTKPNISIQNSNNNDNIITTINRENETIETTIGTNGATNDSNESNCGTKLPTGTYDPTPYIQRARVTRPAPPKPSCNPLQFVQIKPCNLYQSAQTQLKRSEEVKKVKEIKKEEAEDWQNNLDNWKSSRRKRVEHIIDRVVEVKKLELEEHDRQRRKSKTFSEMLEERGERKGRSNKLASLTVYTEDEANDLSDLGIGTSSASGKSSLSEDYDNHSVMSDNVDTEKQNFGDIDNNSNNDGEIGETIRDYISSPGYDTSSSTAPASSPDPCEYTYEGAIQDYKTRISRATTASTTNYNNGGSNSNGFRSNISSPYSKDSTPERIITTTNDNNLTNQQYLPLRRMSGSSKIEDRLMNFEVKSSNNDNIISDITTVSKKDLPKVDILKRRELFEKDKINNSSISQKRFSGDFSNTKSIRERLSSLEKKIDDPPTIMSSNKNTTNRKQSNDLTSIKDRLQNLEIKQNNCNNNNETNDHITSSTDQSNNESIIEKSIIGKVNVSPVTVSIKDRLSSLQNAVTKEEIKKPIMLIDEHQLEILKEEDYNNKQAAAAAVAMAESLKVITENVNLNGSQELLNIHQDESNIDTDREDSGIHTTDVSCSVSQTDEQPELVNEESHSGHHINIDALCDNNITSISTNIETVQEDNMKLNVVEEYKEILIEPSESLILTSPIYHESTEELSTSSIVMSPSSEDQFADLESSVSLSDSQSISSSNTIIINDSKQLNHNGDGHIYENILVGNINSNNNNGDKDLVVTNSNKSINQYQNKIITSKLSPNTDDKYDMSNNGRHLICIINPKTINNTKTINLNNDNKSENLQVVVDSQQNYTKKNINNIISEINLSNIVDDTNVNKRNTNELIKKSNKIIENSLTKQPAVSEEDIVKNMKRSKTIEEICDKIDIKKLPHKYHKSTPYFEISLDDIANCEKNLSPQESIVNSKQNINSIISDTVDRPISETSCSKVFIEPKVFAEKSIKNSYKPVSPIKCSPNEIVNNPQSSSPIKSSPTSPKPTNNKISKTPPVLPPLNSSPQKSTPSSPIFSISPMKTGDYHILKKPPSTPNSPKPSPKITPSTTPTTLSPQNSLTRPSTLNLKSNSSSVNRAGESNAQLIVENLDETQKNPGLLVARLEIVETSIKVTSTDNSPLSTPKSSNSPNGSIKSIKSLESPTVNRKTHPISKPKNIFDFLKKNFTSDDTASIDSTDNSNNSIFYISPPIKSDSPSCSSSITSGNTEVNIEITKITKTEKIVEKTDLGDKELNMADELNQYLNKEIKKSITEQTKL